MMRFYECCVTLKYPYTNATVLTKTLAFEVRRFEHTVLLPHVLLILYIHCTDFSRTALLLLQVPA